MLEEVVARPISDTHALDPTVGGDDLSVPTVLRVMGHFLLQVLSEPDSVWQDTDAGQEEVGPADEVGQGFVVDYLLVYRLF